MIEERTARRKRQRRQIIFGASLLALLAIVSFSGAGTRVAHAQTATIAVRPSKTQLAPAETFNVSVVQNVDEPTIAAQGNLYFDASLLKVVSIEPGPDYADAQFIVGDAASEVAATVEEAIAAANGSGVLANIGVFYLPGSGVVDSGEHQVVSITMQALPSAAGTSLLKFDSRQVMGLDPYGHEVPHTQEVGVLLESESQNGDQHVFPATVQQSQVTVVAGATPAPAPSAGVSTTPTPTRKPAASGGATVNPAVAAQIKMTVTPGSLDVKSGQTGTATVEVDAPFPIAGGGFKLAFDKSLSITEIKPGEKWQLSSPPNYSTTISRANEAGEVNLSIKQKTGSSPLAAGKVTLFTITFKPASGDASTDLTLSQGYVLDEDGNNVEIAALAAESIAESGGGGGGSSILLIVGGLLGVGVLGGGGFYTWRTTRRNRWEE